MDLALSHLSEVFPDQKRILMMEKEIDYLPSDEETIEGTVSEESIEKGKFKILLTLHIGQSWQGQRI